MLFFPHFARSFRFVAFVALTACLALNLCSCNQNKEPGTNIETITTNESNESISINGSVATDEDLAMYDFSYSKRDTDPSFDTSNACIITLAQDASSIEGNGAVCDGNTITINQAGTYLLSGSLNDGMIIVNVGDEEKVQLVLDSVSISNTAGPCIYVQNADKTFITLADGSSNYLADSSIYSIDNEGASAALFSKDDLCLNGNGSLQVVGSYRHGIASKDDLIITGGNYTINAIEDALLGKDCIKICAGNFTLSSGEDALKSSNSDVEGKGFIAIDGGSFVINAGDDAVHAEKLIRITGGEFDIQTCYEGYEAELIDIRSGSHAICASDDGINAAASGNVESHELLEGGTNGVSPGIPMPAIHQGSDSCLIRISGGDFTIVAGGDCLDSNGSLSISGGVFTLSCTSFDNTVFDADLGCEISESASITILEGTDGRDGSMNPGGMGQERREDTYQPPRL